MHVVRHEDDGRSALAQQARDALGHQVRTHLGVDCREYIIQENDRGARVARARERHARLLPPRQIHATLAYLGHISGGELREVRVEGACGEDACVRGGVVRQSEENVVSHRLVLDPGLLRAHRNRSAQDHAPREQRHITDERREKARLTAAHGAADADERSLREGERDADKRRRQHRLRRVVLGHRGRRRDGPRRHEALAVLATLAAAGATANAATGLLLLLLLILRLGPLESACAHRDGVDALRRRRGLVEDAVLERERIHRGGRPAGREVVVRGGCRQDEALHRALGRAQKLGEASVDDEQIHQSRDHHRDYEQREAEHLKERERRVRNRRSQVAVGVVGRLLAEPGHGE
mmetsp:Transcript_26610/g.67655  ORF Transcript_26610/g.67655 Transcript_26610/m.67655 type:complete len:352 (-) Transcript_26610:496-1551(-)